METRRQLSRSRSNFAWNFLRSLARSSLDTHTEWIEFNVGQVRVYFTPR